MLSDFAIHWKIGAIFAALSLLAHGAPEKNKFVPAPKDPSIHPVPPSTQGPIDFVGNKSFQPADFLEPLAESIKELNQGVNKPRADDTAYFLALFYRKQGFPDADVQWEIRGSRVVLTIKEGVRTYLDRVVFEGNRSQSNDTLYQYMIGETQENLKKKPADFPFVEGDMQGGVARIRGLYETEGRLDAIVNDAIFTYSADRSKASVLVKIVEGPRYTFAPPVFAGKLTFPRARLIEALGTPLTTPFTTQRANGMQHNLEYFFKLQGYYAAQVAVIADPKAARHAGSDGRLVTATFTITPGALYRFDGVKVTGLDRLKPAFMQNRFRKLHGQVYSPVKLDESFREVLRTGLFKNLRVNTVALPTDEVRIDLTAEEAKAREIGLSIGFSTYEGALLGIRLADRDFQGRGRPLSLDIDYSTRSLKAEVLYVDPWLFESDYSLRARIFAQTRTEVGYSHADQGLRADLTRKVTPHVDLAAFLQLKNVNVTDNGMSPSFLGPTSYQIASIGLTQQIDYRDNPVNPTKGWILSTALDADTIASQLAFARGTGRFSWYIPLANRFQLCLGARGGLIFPVAEDIPIDERYFNGGGTTVRSFTERKLGPKDPHHFPIGGEAFTVFNAELEIPIKDALFGAVFADAGNLIQAYQDAGFQEMRYALGVGVRYKLPIGPIRLDLGINPNRKDLEKWGAVNFSFGFAF